MAGGRRPRPRKGDRRIDAAIDHFKPMGYAEADIRSTVDQLLEVYGQDGWRFLEEDAYHVVQEALFENEEQQEKPLLLLVQWEKQQPQTLSISEPRGLRHYFVVALVVAIFHLGPYPFL